MDPYLKLVNREEEFETKPHTDGGKHPVWNEKFSLDVKYIGDELCVACFDKNIGSDEPIGHANIKLSALCMNQGFDEWWTIAHKGESAGKVHLKGDWFPDEPEKEEEKKQEAIA